jgi:antitoxin (DNA-binding transcriptional repressor) of toxin-antitoxin stability system
VDLPLGPIYWRVQSSLVATWSTVDSFSILSDSIPLLIRYNGASAASSRPPLRWRRVQGATGYRVQYATNPQFTSAFTVTVTDTFYVPGVALANDTWYWRVSCSRNYALYSPADSFIVDTDGLLTMRPAAAADVVLVRRVGDAVIVDAGAAVALSATVHSLDGRLVARLVPHGQPGQFVWRADGSSGRPVLRGAFVVRLVLPSGVRSAIVPR